MFPKFIQEEYFVRLETVWLQRKRCVGEARWNMNEMDSTYDMTMHKVEYYSELVWP